MLLVYTLSFSCINLNDQMLKDKFPRMDLQNILSEQLVNHHYCMLKHLLGLLFISKYTRAQAHIPIHHKHTTQTHIHSAHTHNHTQKHLNTIQIYEIQTSHTYAYQLPCTPQTPHTIHRYTSTIQHTPHTSLSLTVHTTVHITFIPRNRFFLLFFGKNLWK